MILQILYTIYIMKHIFFHTEVSRKKEQEEAKLKNESSSQIIKPRILSMNTIAMVDSLPIQRKHRKSVPLPSYLSSSSLPKIDINEPVKTTKNTKTFMNLTKNSVEKTIIHTKALITRPETNILSDNVPSLVFIIPYRDRAEHRSQFLEAVDIYFKQLKKEKDYIILFSHQFDERPFNRGAIKNLGFIYIKQKYPKDYKNISFIFNDVDIFPTFDISLDYYRTTHGTIKHFYGVDFALGGSISITGYDFERINGFPNYWEWGMEDNVLHNRALSNTISIDRSNMEKIGTDKYTQLHHGDTRVVDNKVVIKMKEDNGENGITTISNIDFSSLRAAKYIEVQFKKWEIPENHNTIKFKTLYQPTQIIQSKYNIKDIL